MVAPTRTPQVRGVKCDLCKKILASATWLDQTKLAKTVDDAKAVLDLISQHELTRCPCIPKNIENLLIGSTYFEVHRLIAKLLDTQVHQKQYELHIKVKQETASELSKNVVINDCNESQKTSRFKIYPGFSDSTQSEKSKHLLKQLIHAIDYWKLAMEDQANPFNPKLALRLGLTHHVIYACYLFKYYKKLDYQLITANLLLNLFKSIEGVTANAVLHANYLLVKSLIDCNQLQHARQYLKQAAKIPSYQDKSHYESILLTCASCELSLLDCDDSYSILDELAGLAVIKPDDKLQHYYARTLAVSIVIKYIHCYPARSDLCFEFYHTFRYICAIIRRCYESSFELVLSEKEVKQQTKQQQQQQQQKHQQTIGQQQNQILDHSWIRFAVCDFAFSTFDLLSSFYIRAGQPEALELLYNGLNLIASRNGSCYWQSRMAVLGANLDSICDKFDDARTKLDNITQIMGQESDSYLMNLLRLDLEVSSLSLPEGKKTVIKKEVVIDLLQRIKTCQSSLSERLFQIDLFDCHTNTFWKTFFNSADTQINNSFIISGNILGNLSLKALKIAILATLRDGQLEEAKNIADELARQLDSMKFNILEYNDCQTILEILVHFADVDKSDLLLLEAVESSQSFLKTGDNQKKLESQFSMLTISGDTESIASATMNITTRNKRPKETRKTRVSSRKGIYDVASRSQERDQEITSIRFFDTIESMINLSTLTKEEMVVAYLRNSEPNPDYLLYRRAHELMFCLRLKDQRSNQEQLLYHFCESSPSNTMRYRWMMFEEQQISPYEPTIGPSATPIKATARSTGNVKHLAFSNIVADIEKMAKSLVKAIPEDLKLIQLKHIADRKAETEHFLIACFDRQSEPTFMHAKRLMAEDKQDGHSYESLTMPHKLATKVQEAKKTLFNNNHISRTEQRLKLEGEIGLILRDLENEWLGCFKFLLCGKILDPSYNEFIDDLANEIKQSIMREHSCNSIVTLKTMLANAPLLSRDEFCKVMSSLFNCASTSREVRESFDKWLKTIEALIGERTPNGFGDSSSSKTDYLQTLDRGQVGLILDKELELIPFESLPTMCIIKQGIFRVPSLRLFNIIASRNCPAVKVDIDETVYMLDPACNLAKTRERFENKLKAQKSWLGTINRAPTPDQLEQWFSTKQVYLFIGHGAGTVYYNGLRKGRGLSALQLVKPAAIVMGCSSGRVLAEGPKLESFGIGWVFVFRGSPSYVGLLWDVTDTDIDKFLDSLLEKWIGNSRWPAGTNTTTTPASQPLYKGSLKSQAKSISSMMTTYTGLSMAQAAAQARHVCRLKFLVGSTPVIYGLPVRCK